MREIIYSVVIIAFGFIICRYKLIPYLAAKKAGKGTKEEKEVTKDIAGSPVLPSQMFMGQHLGYPVFTPQSEKPSRRDMYFDFRLIGTDNVNDVSAISECLELYVNEMLSTLRNRGICPESLDIVPLGDGFLLAYVTYVL